MSSELATLDLGAPWLVGSETPPTVCVQGLGFVGAAVAVAIASARTADGRPAYRVRGVDQATGSGLARIEALNRGEFPFPITDAELAGRLRQACAVGNLEACADARAFASAATILIDVGLDVLQGPEAVLDLGAFRDAVRAVGQNMRADALVIIETTVPPGTTELVAAPILRQELARRGLPTDQLRLAHCYERVTPGASYLESVVNMPRVYAGIDERSADVCGAFLRSILSQDCPPPVRLSGTTASELGKILENTYRAVTIAMMEEFAACAEAVGVDLYEVVDAIRMRPTHSNMRTPGFGVGGYCLTKDPLMAELAMRELFGQEQAFPFSSLAVAVNRTAPKRAFDRLKRLLGGSVRGRRILLLGVSYRQDVGDTRRSPSEVFWDVANSQGADVLIHDPLVRHWPELDLPVPDEIPSAAGLDAVVLAVPHAQYRAFPFEAWLGSSRPVFLDAFDVLSRERRDRLRVLGCRVESVGRGCSS